MNSEPGSAPYLRLLDECARVRRRLGLPSLTFAELAALLEPELAERRRPLPSNVVRFPGCVRGRRAHDR